MQVHDWKKAPGGLFHHFHQRWSIAMCDALNSGLLPKGFYTLIEQHAGEAVPDLLTLQRHDKSERPRSPRGGVALAEIPPKTRFVNRGSELEVYAAKANKLAIRDSDGELIAVIEIVSPGNKHSKLAIRKFVEKSVELIRFGIHLLVIDLISPGPRDPQGLHQLIWGELESEDFRLPRGKPLTLASYCCGDPLTAFIDPVAIGGKLPDMPVFIDSGTYVPVPLAETYAASWNVCPVEFREDVLASQK
jgi:hypothetical protein